MNPTCHLLLLCVSNSENYHLMCWNFKTYRLVYHETCLSGNRSSSLENSGHLLRRPENNKPLHRELSGEPFFRARTPFFRWKPLFFHLLQTSRPSYTTFVLFCFSLATLMKTLTQGWSFFWRRCELEMEVWSPDIGLISKTYHLFDFFNIELISKVSNRRL